jgi:hypothetical protein
MKRNAKVAVQTGTDEQGHTVLLNQGTAWAWRHTCKRAGCNHVIDQPMRVGLPDFAGGHPENVTWIDAVRNPNVWCALHRPTAAELAQIGA